MTTSRKGRQRCFILSSVSFATFFSLMVGNVFPQQGISVLPPAPATAGAARSHHVEKDTVSGVLLSDKKTQTGGEGCLDGTGALPQGHSAEGHDRSLIENHRNMQEMHDSFTAWITGTQNVYTLLYIDMFPSLDEKQADIRGLAASRNIQKGEVVVSIPFRAMISLDSIEQDPVLSNILSRENREIYGWYDEIELLIVFLLYHKALGHSSPIYPYILILQSAPIDQMPFMWKRELLHEIYPNPSNGVRIATELIYDDVLAMYEEIIPVLARLYPDVFAEPVQRQQQTMATTAMTGRDNNTISLSSNATEWAYSYRNFLWAFAMVNSRHWHVPCDDLDHVTTRNSKEINTEIKVNGQSERKLPTSDEAPKTITRAVKDSVANDGKGSRLDAKTATSGRDHTFLLPFADLLNFGEPCTRGEYNAEKGAFEITASCDIEKGKEVTLWYTDECNDLVLANFGFTHPLVQKCKTLEEWKRHSSQLEAQLTETREYVEYLKLVIGDLEKQLKPCQDLTGLNTPHRHGYKKEHMHRTDASFLDTAIEPPVLDYIIEGQKLRSSIRRAGQVPFDDNL